LIYVLLHPHPPRLDPTANQASYAIGGGRAGPVGVRKQRTMRLRVSW
jgi:hypothetical protein